MKKIRIGTDLSVFPMPVTLIGTTVDGKANFMTAAWVTRVNFQPAMIAFATSKSHYTVSGIRQNKSFSVNIPSVDSLEKTDYCGIISGEKVDKSRVFKLFYGETPNTPMIEECPVCIECRLFSELELPSDYIFVGEVVQSYTEQIYLSDGKLDILKINPFTLSTPDNNYWRVGELAGKAWSAGKKYKME